jgi:hypothetical protein
MGPTNVCVQLGPWSSGGGEGDDIDIAALQEKIFPKKTTALEGAVVAPAAAFSFCPERIYLRDMHISNRTGKRRKRDDRRRSWVESFFHPARLQSSTEGTEIDLDVAC